ncbi:hypothetical protein P154DRAFT_603999 [Amniculicola lignicola CBS 123094]|uniref:Uncharacterized protein n=1 Tax=Amniculicola lignicola CBS 123094 TaxID=1392246 RepID=A0A6A5WZK8_9PLEO|nr:hypothetical protein P154DRAFT_603999 [Amniculicola lignicola CBS 123094]
MPRWSMSSFLSFPSDRRIRSSASPPENMLEFPVEGTASTTNFSRRFNTGATLSVASASTFQGESEDASDTATSLASSIENENRTISENCKRNPPTSLILSPNGGGNPSSAHEHYAFPIFTDAATKNDQGLTPMEEYHQLVGIPALPAECINYKPNLTDVTYSDLEAISAARRSINSKVPILIHEQEAKSVLNFTIANSKHACDAQHRAFRPRVGFNTSRIQAEIDLYFTRCHKGLPGQLRLVTLEQVSRELFALLFLALDEYVEDSDDLFLLVSEELQEVIMDKDYHPLKKIWQSRFIDQAIEDGGAVIGIWQVWMGILKLVQDGCWWRHVEHQSIGIGHGIMMDVG